MADKNNKKPEVDDKHRASDDIEGKLLKHSRKVLRVTNEQAGHLENPKHFMHTYNVLTQAIHFAEKSAMKKIPNQVDEAAATGSGAAMGKIIRAVNDYNDVVSDFIGVNSKRFLKGKARKILLRSIESLYAAREIVYKNPDWPRANKAATVQTEALELIGELAKHDPRAAKNLFERVQNTL